MEDVFLERAIEAGAIGTFLGQLFSSLSFYYWDYTRDAPQAYELYTSE